MKKPNGRSGKFLVDLGWNLVVIVATAGTCYVLYMRGYLDPYLTRPANLPIPALSAFVNGTAMPANSPSAVAAPTPEASAASMAANSPASSETPVPAASEANLPLSAVEPRFLPKQVKLLKPVQFEIISNGHTVGSLSAPVGMLMSLVTVKGSDVEVSNGTLTKVIPATDTDVAVRVHALKDGVR